MPYLRDLVYDAAENGTRLFLSHLTSSTHHPWRLPRSFQSEQYTGEQGSVDHDSMNSYLNTVRYVDDWLGEILNLLDEAGIANSTLVVIVGDQYVFLPVFFFFFCRVTNKFSGQAFSEDAKVTGTFENGHISNFRVPIVFRHPRLPHIDVSANATSLSIIPTILDLLVQSQSLDEKDSAIASSLLPEYQGQSLLRPFRNERPDDGQLVWNFALINGGGAILAITSTNAPYRLILPLKEEFNYRFTNLEKDPGEAHPLEGWSIPRLVDRIRRDHGDQAATWLIEAEMVGRWWVAEQKRIWDYRGE